MKKIIMFFMFATLLSCSNDDQVSKSIDAGISSNGSVLEGGILAFKNEESFVKEYSHLAELNKNELQNWISEKKVNALLNTTSDSLALQEDVIADSRLMYSDALKSILNSESKVKIGNKVLWLNERNFYLLSGSELNKTSTELISSKDNLEVYGQLLSLAGSSESLTSRNVIPNENRTITFVTPEQTISGSRLRHVVDLFNETIVLNDQIQTSKMYLRTILQYRSCSTFRCTWKEALNVRTFSTTLFCGACGNGSVAPWSLTDINVSGISGTQTYLLANWTISYVLANPYTNFAVSGPVTSLVPGGAFPVNISWY
ncbi:hypothetical protein Q1W71_11705 [Flavobacterium pectinovorum]|uniref:hypothetical protein n=1 Tax=Flavobacterium pectinovorum TaxID=29533 RepID=UPI00265ED2B2|nr:hypothetical protein [Flavobacterium pectinovorum]WKL50414.1 hypothetical protein Q1W71_11705 [Flavobacterium pectinovorum]